MKKWAYIIGGSVIGFTVATAGSAFADQVKSLIGKKVTGEYTVVVNGKTLQDKGAVIDNKTSAPVRALSEALGADVKVEGKTIVVTTDSGDQENNTPVKFDVNDYRTWDKKSLEERKASLENDFLKPRNEERKEILAQIEKLKTAGMDGGPADSLVPKQEQLKEYEEAITKYTKELEQVNAALAALENK